MTNKKIHEGIINACTETIVIYYDVTIQIDNEIFKYSAERGSGITKLINKDITDNHLIDVIINDKNHFLDIVSADVDCTIKMLRSLR